MREEERQREEGRPSQLNSLQTCEGLGSQGQELFCLIFELRDFYLMSCELSVYSHCVHPFLIP